MPGWNWRPAYLSAPGIPYDDLSERLGYDGTMSEKTMRLSFSTKQSKPPAKPAVTPAIQIWVPDDIHDYALVREAGETDESYEERKSLFDTLLKLGGA